VRSTFMRDWNENYSLFLASIRKPATGYLPAIEPTIPIPRSGDGIDPPLREMSGGQSLTVLSIAFASLDGNSRSRSISRPPPLKTDDGGYRLWVVETSPPAAVAVLPSEAANYRAGRKARRRVAYDRRDYRSG
jgi:hypothetical protein